MESEHLPVELPLHLPEWFRMWDYSASHSTLVLRSGDWNRHEYLDVVFTSVRGVQLRAAYDGLRISVVEDAGEVAAVDGFAGPVGESYLRLKVSDGTHDGFVVCGRVSLLRTPAGAPDPF